MVNQEWLIRFVEHRIGDKRIVRLVRKWLKAGILEDGVVAGSDRGTGQGSVISPLLANISCTTSSTPAFARGRLSGPSAGDGMRLPAR
jgi:retron-type reverse transcriptase